MSRSFKRMFLVFLVVALVATQFAIPESGTSAQEDITTNGYVTGNAFDLFPAGEPGGIAILQIGQPSFEWYPIVFRNNTQGDIGDVKGQVRAKNQQGEVVAIGWVTGVLPGYIPKGELGWLSFSFEGVSIPADAVFEYELNYVTIGDVESSFAYPLVIAGINEFSDHFIGTVRNDHDAELDTAQINLLCVNADGTIDHIEFDYADFDTIPANSSREFQYKLSNPCPKFLITSLANGPLTSSRSLAPQLIPPQSTIEPTPQETEQSVPPIDPIGDTATASGPDYESTITALQTQVAELQQTPLPTPQSAPTPASTVAPKPTSTPISRATSTPRPSPTPTAAADGLTITEWLYLDSMYRVINSIYAGFSLLDQGGQVNIISASAQWHASLITALNMSVPKRLEEIHQQLLEVTRNFDKAATEIDDTILNGQSLNETAWGTYVTNGTLALFDLDDLLQALSRQTGEELSPVVPE